MDRNPNQQPMKRKKPREIVAVLADKYGVSIRFVNMVIKGEREHQSITDDYLSAIKNKPESNQNTKRRAGDPYNIHLDNNDYILTEEILNENVSRQVSRLRGWHFPELKFISFRNGKLELRNDCNNISHTLTIRIDKNRLQVSCSCNTEVEMLCIHAYKAIERMIQFNHSYYFQQYRPKGLMEIATAHKKYFRVRSTSKGLDIIPKQELGSIYQLDQAVQNIRLNELLKLPEGMKSAPAKLKEMALTYIIIVSHRNELLPFVLPCVAKLSKEGGQIKRFANFLTVDQTGYDEAISDPQKVLNNLCYKTRKLAEKLPGVIGPENGAGEIAKNTESLFELWQSIIPMLWQQRFVFTYHLYGKLEVKGKPQIQRIAQSHLIAKSPSLRFRLTEQQSLHHLEMKAFTDDVEITNFELEPTFFISKGQDLYFLPSLRDAAMAEWMRNMNNRITVFKEHFPGFEKDFLKPLREFYEVDMVRYRKK